MPTITGHLAVSIACYSPNSITRTLMETSLREKFQTQIMKVAFKNGDRSLSFGESREHISLKLGTQIILTCRDVCDKVRDKPVCVAVLEFSSLQCMGKVSDKLSRLQIMRIRDINHESW